MPKALIKAVKTGQGSGAYLRGHVVGVFPDEHVFGAEEGLPNFYVAEVPQGFVDDQPELAIEELDGEELVRRRKWQFDVDSLPPGILQALESGGLASIPRGVANEAVKREERLSLSAIDIVGNGRQKGR